MHAIEISQPGAPEVLKPVERPDPTPAAGEVLIRVAAAGVNRPDVLQRRGAYPPPPGASDLPGLEVSGTIEALGAGVTTWRVGERVCALLSGGGYATRCVAPAVQCLPVPAAMDFVSAAAVPETFFTVWTNVFDRGRLKAGETALFHGGLERHRHDGHSAGRGARRRVFATAGRMRSAAPASSLGAERAINYKTEDFVAVIKDVTKGRGVDLILDIVGGDYIARDLRRSQSKDAGRHRLHGRRYGDARLPAAFSARV
jgi:putative PIG3 family NAD(P)H quinone oxidoreductase